MFHLSLNNTIDSPSLLSICPDIERLETRAKALKAAGFRVVSVSTIQAAAAVAQCCDFSLVMVDHDCPSEVGELEFRGARVLASVPGDDGISKALNTLLSAQRNARPAAGSLAA